MLIKIFIYFFIQRMCAYTKLFVTTYNWVRNLKIRCKSLAIKSKDPLHYPSKVNLISNFYWWWKRYMNIRSVYCDRHHRICNKFSKNKKEKLLHFYHPPTSFYSNPFHFEKSIHLYVHNVAEWEGARGSEGIL